MSEKCDTCKRGETYFEGCSFNDCPKRKVITARPADITKDIDSLSLYSETGCSFKVPSNLEQ